MTVLASGEQARFIFWKIKIFSFGLRNYSRLSGTIPFVLRINKTKQIDVRILLPADVDVPDIPNWNRFSPIFQYKITVKCEWNNSADKFNTTRENKACTFIEALFRIIYVACTVDDGVLALKLEFHCVCVCLSQWLYFCSFGTSDFLHPALKLKVFLVRIKWA